MFSAAAIVSRRHVLAAIGALATWYRVPAGLRAEGVADFTPEGLRTLHARAGGYEGAAPGPLLRLKHGAELRLRLVNELPDATAIHWHGVRIENPMDGGLMPAAVAPGASFDYRFQPPDAGTFWYHAPWRGSPASSGPARSQHLHGVLIVEEAEPPDIDREHVLLFDDWPVAAEGKPLFQIRANGLAAPDLPVKTNERLRLRLVNAASARVLSVRIDRHVATVMAIDGQPAQPFRARDSRVTLAPGNTADLFVDAGLEPGAVAPILLGSAGEETVLARLAYESGPPSRPAPRSPAAALQENPLPARLDLVHAVKVDLPTDRLASKAPHALPALFRAKRGRTVVLGLVNRQEAPCAAHVHGHVFRLLDRLDDGWKPFWLATVLVDAGQTARIAFRADIAGKWLIECVAIDRPDSVTAGWFEVA